MQAGGSIQQVMGPHGLSAVEFKSFEVTITSLMRNIRNLEGSDNFDSWYKDIKQLFILKDLWYKFVCPLDEIGILEVKITDEEVKNNIRARSGKMRVLERIL